MYVVIILADLTVYGTFDSYEAARLWAERELKPSLQWAVSKVDPAD